MGAILDPGLTGVFKWVSHYLILGTLRVLAYVSNERFETLSAIASVQRVDVMKIILLLIWINVCNAVWLRQCTFIFQGESFTSDNGANGEELVSWSIMFVILYESTILMLESGKCLFKLAVHWLSVFSESSFQKKSTWIYYCELVTEVSAYAVTFGHYLHIWALCGISFTLVDAVLLLNLRAVFLSLTKCLEAHQRFRNAIMFLEHTYEEATGRRDGLCATRARFVAFASATLTHRRPNSCAVTTCTKLAFGSGLNASTLDSLLSIRAQYAASRLLECLHQLMATKCTRDLIHTLIDCVAVLCTFADILHCILRACCLFFNYY